jgi:hypothetical protein
MTRRRRCKQTRRRHTTQHPHSRFSFPQTHLKAGFVLGAKAAADATKARDKAIFMVERSAEGIVLGSGKQRRNAHHQRHSTVPIFAATTTTVPTNARHHRRNTYLRGSSGLLESRRRTGPSRIAEVTDCSFPAVLYKETNFTMYFETWTRQRSVGYLRNSNSSNASKPLRRRHVDATQQLTVRSEASNESVSATVSLQSRPGSGSYTHQRWS